MRPGTLSDSTLSIHPEAREFFEILKSQFGLKEEALHLAFEVCKVTGEKLGDALVRLGHLSEADRKRCQAMQWGLTYVDLDVYPVTPVPAEVVEPQTFLQYKIVPVSWDGRNLTVAISDPLDLRAVEDLRVLTGVEVRAVIASEEQISKALGEIPAHTGDVDIPDLEMAPLDDEVVFQDTIETVSANFGDEESGGPANAYQLSALAEEAPVIKLVNSLLVRAIRDGASDLHIQPEDDSIRSRYRVDGILRDGPRLPRPLMRPLIARLRVMASLDLTESRHPQDGRINLKMGDRTFQLRISLFPSIVGYSAVVRMAEQTDESLSLKSLGLSRTDLERYTSVVERPNGLVLITGPTGSGKSTTLYATLSHLNGAERKILTIEDPAERQLAGVTQMEINEVVNLTFADGLRSALRHDPDVIMVGEIRDAETAGIAVQSSLTGHMVFSTLHTNDAASAVTRLVNMGVEPFLVASSLAGVMAQRLVRVLCTNCRQPYEVPAEQLQEFGVDRSQSLSLYHPAGCEKCVGSGYSGRAPVFELLLHSPAIERLILEGAADSAIRKKAIEEGMQTLQQEVARRVGEGLTSVEEAMRVVQAHYAFAGQEGEV